MHQKKWSSRMQPGTIKPFKFLFHCSMREEVLGSTFTAFDWHSENYELDLNSDLVIDLGLFQCEILLRFNFQNFWRKYVNSCGVKWSLPPYYKPYEKGNNNF